MIEIARVTGLATIQDTGRPGWMHAGVPHGGAMVPELLARANVAAENADDEAAIEAFGAIALVAHAPVTVGLGDGSAHALGPGEPLDVPAPRDARVTYIAMRGGIDVPRVLGGRGTLLVAGIGGHEGRALRSGDVLRVGSSGRKDPRPLLPTSAGPIRVIMGPDIECFPNNAIDRLFAEPFTISPASDRTGTRLSKPRLAVRSAGALASMPMVRGAIEVTPEGQLIVMGPDHPTTGGYPVIGCIVTRDFGRFMALPLGREVRFSAPLE